MRMVKVLAVAALMSILLVNFGSGGTPATKEEAKARINALLDEYNRNFDSGNFEDGLRRLDEILDLCKRFSFRKEFVIQITDQKDFALMKMGRFDESLEIAFQLEKMAGEIGQGGNPWYCLKIADSYLGLKNIDKTLEWIKKAVYERGFKNCRYLQNPQYEALQKDSRFQKLITDMKDKIGLQHPAKDFKTALVNGGTFSLSDQRGKVVLIDFWDVQCAPCVKAIPELKTLYDKYHKQGLEIIGVSLDTDENLLKSFLEAQSIPWLIGCSFKGYDDEAAKLYGINATPSTWLVDRKGILQYNEVKGEELNGAIEELLKNL